MSDRSSWPEPPSPRGPFGPGSRGGPEADPNHAASPRQPPPPRRQPRPQDPPNPADPSSGPEPPDAPDAPPPPAARHARRSGSEPPRWRRRILPGALLFGALVAALAAVLLDDAPRAEAIGPGSAETPLLSARRAPELLAGPLAARRLQAELQPWMTRSPQDSCLVVEAPTGPLFAHNPDQPVPGGSTQKVITATAMLLSATPDTRFETVASSVEGVANDGVLAGDLYLVGGGDPLLSTSAYREHQLRGGDRLVNLEELADQLVADGLSHLQGSVVGDDSRYDDERFNTGAWPDRFVEQNQAGPISALNVNDGFSSFPAEPGALTSRVRSDDPAANGASVLTELLQERGVTVDGTPISGQAREGAEPVASMESPPLREIVAQMLTDSDNATAEMFLKELGLEEGGGGTWDEGAAAARGVLEDGGVDMEGMEILDGSGLSDQDRLSCQLLVDLLVRPETGPIIVDGLAVAGESGTLEDDFTGTAVEGRMRAKTGTLRNVNALAGQVTPVEGGLLTFAYVATVPSANSLTTDQIDLADELGQILVEHSDEIDTALLLPQGYPQEGEGEIGAESGAEAEPAG